MQNKKLVIVGDGEFAEIAYEYFTHDSEYEVVGFAVESSFLDNKELYGLPITAFENIEQQYPANSHSLFVAITYTALNRVRTRLYQTAKKMGYRFATYISSKAFVWNNATVGENSFVFENNVIQHHAEIGDNVILWSGNHIGHRAKIADNCFIASHVVVSGYVEIGANSFIGVNASFADYIKVGKDSFIAMASVVTKSLSGGYIYKGNPAVQTCITSEQYFKLNHGEVSSL